MVMLGDDARLTCNITKAYDDRVIWSRTIDNVNCTEAALSTAGLLYKNNTNDKIDSSRWTKIESNYTKGGPRNSSLQIKELKESDAGQYWCTAFNEANRSQSAVIELVVRGKFLQSSGKMSGWNATSADDFTRIVFSSGARSQPITTKACVAWDDDLGETLADFSAFSNHRFLLQASGTPSGLSSDSWWKF